MSLILMNMNNDRVVGVSSCPRSMKECRNNQVPQNQDTKMQAQRQQIVDSVSDTGTGCQKKQHVHNVGYQVST